MLHYLKKSIVLFTIIYMIGISFSFAQEETPEEPEQELPGIITGERYIPKYEAGQGSISLGLNVLVPLFFQKFTGEYITDTRLTVGGSAWLEWDIYLWQALSVGMEIDGAFALSPNNRFLLIAPITAHVKYVFQAYPIEFPLSLGIGFSLVSYDSIFKSGFVLKPKFGTGYRINQNWIVSIFGSYLFDVQSYQFTLGNEYSRMGNFFEAGVGFTYVF